MRDVFFTLASAHRHTGILHVEAGGRETFVDVRGRVAVRFLRIQGRLVARVYASPAALGTTASVSVPASDASLLALRCLLRRAVGADTGGLARS